MLRRLSVVSCYCAKKVIRSNTTLSTCVLKINPTKQVISTYFVSRSFTDHAHDHAHKDEVTFKIYIFITTSCMYYIFLQLYCLLQPFLDPKQVTERIIEVIKNFEKVRNILNL